MVAKKHTSIEQEKPGLQNELKEKQNEIDVLKKKVRALQFEIDTDKNADIVWHKNKLGMRI